MTDRLKGLTVVLKQNMRDDDAEPIMNAIRQLKGVLEVSPHIAGSDHYMAVVQARHEMGTRLWEVLYPKDSK